jgi:hypothetical protein
MKTENERSENEIPSKGKPKASIFITGKADLMPKLKEKKITTY